MSSPDDLVTATKNEVIAINNIGQILKDFTSLSSQDVFDPYNLSVYNGVPDCTLALQAVLDTCFGTSAAPHGATSTSNKEFVLPPGTFNITSPLLVTNVRGGTIRGGGRFATSIVNTAGGDVFVTNGFEYSRVFGIRFSGAGTTGTVFNLDWGGGGSTSLQSNTFSDVFFNGSGIGVLIGETGHMGSENLFLNCFFQDNTIAGIKTHNFNALQNTIVGGDFQGCGIGVWVRSGSVPGIYSVGFQANTVYDISVDNSSNDTYNIDACRSESVNFGSFSNGPIVSISGCTQTNVTAGDFAVGGATLSLQGCQSVNGRVSSSQLFRVTVEDCIFGRADWQQGAAVYLVDGLGATLIKNNNFTLNQYFINNALLVCESGGSPWTVTIPSEANMLVAVGWVIPIGVRIDVIQYNTVQITIAADGGVGLHTARSLTTRARYSVITLTKTGTDDWVVSGDLT